MVGISQNEKFCSQCGGPNTNYIDVLPYGLPATNIGQRIDEYTTPAFQGEYSWQLPRVGELRRITIVTNKILDYVVIEVNGRERLVNVRPRTNEFIYTGNLHLQNHNNVMLRIGSSRHEQQASIILETDPVEYYESPPQKLSRAMLGIQNVTRALQGR